MTKRRCRNPSRTVFENAARLLRALAIAGTASAIGAGCGPQPDLARTGRTADEIQQLIDVTDSAVRLFRNPVSADNPVSELHAAVRPVVAAVEAARAQDQRHSAAILAGGRAHHGLDERFETIAYSRAASCVRANLIELSDIERYIERLHEVRVEDHEPPTEARRRMLIILSQNATDCALLATEYLRAVEDLDAVERIGLLIGRIYAAATAFHSATGLGGEGLLDRYIAANEAIIAKLAPACEQRQRAGRDAPGIDVPYPCVSHRLAIDALPKLKAASSRTAAEHSAPVHTVTSPDEIGLLVELVDRTADLIQAMPRDEASSPDLDTAIQRVAAAVAAAGPPLQRQAAEARIRNRLDAMTYAKVRACIESSVISLKRALPLMQRLNAARLQRDDAAANELRGIIGYMAMGSPRCYGYGTTAGQFSILSGLDAVNGIGVVAGEAFATDTALRAMSGFTRGKDQALRNQIEVNEAILARLAFRCGKRRFDALEAPIVKVTHPCASHKVAMDTLPKLRSVLSRLDPRPVLDTERTTARTVPQADR